MTRTYDLPEPQPLYVVIAGDVYYPCAGTNDWQGAPFVDKDDAIAYATHERSCTITDWCVVVEVQAGVTPVEVWSRRT